ncbi:MAG: hypothetical protein ACYC4Q_08450 [Victivallaceae bacterium]
MTWGSGNPQPQQNKGKFKKGVKICLMKIQVRGIFLCHYFLIYRLNGNILISQYIKQIAKQISIIWIIVTGIISITSYIGIGNDQTVFVRALVVSLVISLFSVMGLLVSGFGFFKKSFDPIKIRKVIKGSHYYKDNILIILNKSQWIEEGQILTLFTNDEDIKTPFCLVRVESFTTAKYPQCAILKSLSNENIPEYLLDASRWPSFSAYPEVKSLYL